MTRTRPRGVGTAPASPETPVLEDGLEMELWQDATGSTGRSCGTGWCGWSPSAVRSRLGTAGTALGAEKLGIGTTETVRKWVRRAEVAVGARPGGPTTSPRRTAPSQGR